MMKKTPKISSERVVARDTRAQLSDCLRALKLYRVETVLDAELEQFHKKNLAPEELLLRLVQAQLAQRTERMIERRIAESRLPERKSLADFEFGFQPSLDKRLIRELATTAFIDRRQGVILAGNSGTGKSHIAKALALEACKRGLAVRYTTAAAMLSDLYSALADNTLDSRLKRYTRPALLVIDELGFDRLEQESARNAALFIKVIDGRYGQSSTIVTTNIDFEQLGHYLGDPVVTTAIVDRMIHHATVITLSGPSYRLKQSRELNQAARSAQEPAAPPPPRPPTRGRAGKAAQQSAAV